MKQVYELSFCYTTLCCIVTKNTFTFIFILVPGVLTTRKTVNFIQDNNAFYLVTCHYNFWWNIEKWWRKTLKMT